VPVETALPRDPAPPAPPVCFGGQAWGQPTCAARDAARPVACQKPTQTPKRPAQPRRALECAGAASRPEKPTFSVDGWDKYCPIVSAALLQRPGWARTHTKHRWCYSERQ